VRLLVIYGVVALVSCAALNETETQSERSLLSVEHEARVFIKEYQDDLRAHRREAIAARYSRKGAYFPGESATVKSFEAIVENYGSETKWPGPVAFEWDDLSYVVLSPDAVLVVGSFMWRSASDTKETEFSYTGALVREDNALRIRIEHEAPR